MSWREYPARIAAGLTVAAGLAGAIAVPAADLDTASVVGVVGGLGTIAIAAAKFLEGQRSWEAEQERTRREVAVAQAAGGERAAGQLSQALTAGPPPSAEEAIEISSVASIADDLASKVVARLAERLRGAPAERGAP